jgi:hypothetical protein
MQLVRNLGSRLIYEDGPDATEALEIGKSVESRFRKRAAVESCEKALGFRDKLD